MKKWIKAKLGAIKKFVYRILFTIFDWLWYRIDSFIVWLESVSDRIDDIRRKFGE